MYLFRIPALPVDQKFMAVVLTLWLMKSFHEDVASLMIFIMESREFALPIGRVSYQMLSPKLTVLSRILEKQLALPV